MPEVRLEPFEGGATNQWASIGAKTRTEEVSQPAFTDGTNSPTETELTRGVEDLTKGHIQTWRFQKEVEAKIPTTAKVEAIEVHCYAKPSSAAFEFIVEGGSNLGPENNTAFQEKVTSGEAGATAGWFKLKVSAVNLEKLNSTSKSVAALIEKLEYAVKNEKASKARVNVLYIMVKYGNAVYSRSASVSQAQSISIPKQPNLARLVTQAQALTIPKQIGKPYPVFQEQALTLQKQPAKPFSLVEEVLLSRGPIVIGKTQALTQSESVTIAKGTSKALSNTQESQPTLRKVPEINRSVSQEATFSMGKKDLALHQSSTQVVTPSVLKAITLGTRKVVQELIGIVNTPQQVELIALAITQGATVGFSKFTQKVVLVTQPVLPKVQMFLPKSFSNTQASVATPIKTVEPKAFATTQPQEAAMEHRYLRLYHVTVEVVQAAIASLRKQAQLNEPVTQETEVNTFRGFEVHLSNVVATTAELIKRFVRHTFNLQSVVLGQSEPATLRNSTAGAIIWTMEEGVLVNIESTLGQFEGELTTGTPDKMSFVRHREQPKPKGSPGSTRDPQWQ